MSLDVTAFTGLGEGSHDIAVTNLEKKNAKAGGEYLRWEFSDRDGRTASANSSVEMTPGNKTGKWFAALTGRPTVVGESRQMSEVIGAPGTILVEINPEGYPKVIALVARKADPRVVQSYAQTPEPLSQVENGAEAGIAGDLPF